MFTILSLALLLLFALPAVSSPVASLITFVVAALVAAIVHFGLSSRVAGIIGFLMTLVSVVSSDQVSGYIPSKYAVPVAIVALVLTGLNERLQGGVTDPTKRAEAVVDAQK